MVAIEAASVNPHDLYVRDGTLRLGTGRRFPMGTGIEFAGQISEVGSEVNLAVGQLVWGSMQALTRHVTGSVADYVVVDADNVGPRPAGLSAVEASSLVVTGATAVRALHRTAYLRPGERVLIRGGAGGTGLASVQVAVAGGGIVTTLSSERDFDVLRAYGATLTLDYRTTGPRDLETFDVIIDTVGRQLLAYRRLLAPSGRMVAIAVKGAAGIAAVPVSWVFGSRRLRIFSDNAKTEDLEVVRDLVEQAALRPDVGQIYDLHEIAEAHRSLTIGGYRGKRVIRLKHPTADADVE
jgi:NADPH:quinone reductase-like Zn-dependent oxidoreductase